MSNRKIRYVHVGSPRGASGVVASVYAQCRRDLGAVVEPIAMHSPDPQLLAAAWMLLRETLLVGRTPRAHREAIAASVAQLNVCPWCVDAHSMMLYATGHSDMARAFDGLLPNTPHAKDPALRAVLEWALATSSPAAAVLGAPPCGPEDASEIIGTAVTFHYLTRMVNVLLVARSLPGPGWVRANLKFAIGRGLGRFLIRRVVPGESLALLPTAMLPSDLQWAGRGNVGGAFARFAHTVDTRTAAVMPPAVRREIDRRLFGWRGEDMGIGRSWLHESLDRMPDDESRAILQLGLLTALASHQIGDDVVAEFRRARSHDSDLVAVTAYGAFAAARRIGTWLGGDPGASGEAVVAGERAARV